MPRIADTARKDALTAKVLLSAELVRISLGCTDSAYTDQTACELNSELWTDDILITTFVQDVPADVGDGKGVLNFEAAKDLLSISDIEESLTMDLGTITLGLSAISGEWLQLSQQMELNNRPVEIWKVLLDPVDYSVINAPFMIFAGVIVTGGIQKTEVDDGSAVEIEVSNQYYSFETQAGFRCNQNDHQKFFPNDTGFKFTSSVPKKIAWGDAK